MPAHDAAPQSPTPAPTAAQSGGAIPADALARIEELFEGAVTENRTAGIAWAIVGGHAHEQDVLAAGAAGDQELRDGSPAPGSRPMSVDSISRIASMTKSFTAASLLRLRDEGRLRLDDRIEEHLPEAADLLDGDAAGIPITLRDLLTMSAGLVTDNPWGDRQEAMTREDFAAMLRGGLGHNSRPGTGFEYSNTGYAMLGRVVDEVSGTSFMQDITEHWLRPLGMADTVFSAEETDRERLAIGQRTADRDDRTRFEPVPFSGPGVYGAMAGLFSTCADIARWIRFLAAADAPVGTPTASAHEDLLSSASRREMQQLHRVQIGAELPAGEDGASPGFGLIRGYGYGLFVERLPGIGDVISHGGGYPGYGSFMCWHRDSGVGIVALANAKYAPASVLAMQALRILAAETDLLAPSRPAPAPRALEAAEAALAWIREADDAVADAWFADNMDLDVPRAERVRRRDAAVEAAGLGLDALGGLTAGDALAVSPAHLQWRVDGASAEHPALRIDMIIDPRRDGLIQAIDLAVSDAPRNY